MSSELTICNDQNKRWVQEEEEAWQEYYASCFSEENMNLVLGCVKDMYLNFAKKHHKIPCLEDIQDFITEEQFSVMSNLSFNLSSIALRYNNELSGLKGEQLDDFFCEEESSLYEFISYNEPDTMPDPEMLTLMALRELGFSILYTEDCMEDEALNDHVYYNDAQMSFDILPVTRGLFYLNDDDLKLMSSVRGQKEYRRLN